MSVSAYLRTKDLAEAGGISVQQVRNYEAAGFIPAPERSPSGYRRYTPRHRAALLATRGLVAAYGWARARAIMAATGRGDLPAALAEIDAHHADLAARRQRAGEILAALGALAAGSDRLAASRPGARLRVGEAARLVGVRVSAVRFWEEQGLLHPTRDADSRYRLYDEGQLRRLRVVALLREGGYDFPTIRAALDALAAGQPERAIAAAERRRAELARATWAALAALAAYREYVDVYCEDMVAAL